MKLPSTLELTCQAVPEDQIRQAMLDVIQHAVRFQNISGIVAEGVATLEEYLQGECSPDDLEIEHQRLIKPQASYPHTAYIHESVMTALVPDHELQWVHLWLVCRHASCWLARIGFRGTNYPDSNEEDWQIEHLTGLTNG